MQKVHKQQENYGKEKKMIRSLNKLNKFIYKIRIIKLMSSFLLQNSLMHFRKHNATSISI